MNSSHLDDIDARVPRRLEDFVEPRTTALVMWDMQKGLAGRSPTAPAMVAAARRLVEAAAAQARRMKADTMFLEVGQHNRAACGLYQSLGFCKVGLRTAYYPDGENALVLKANLPLSGLG